MLAARRCFNDRTVSPIPVIPHEPSGIQKRRSSLNPIRILGILLIVGGAFGLLYGGFSHDKDTTAMTVGPIELSVQERHTIHVPVWAGVGAIVLGGFLLVAGKGKGR